MKNKIVLQSEATSFEISENAKTILRENNLDWRIHKLPLIGLTHELDDDGDSIPKQLVTEDFGLFRSDNHKCLGSGFKKGYTVSQNDEILEAVLRGSAGFGELSVQKAGELHEGRKIFIQLKLEGFARVANDEIEKYVTIIDSNDGSTGLSVGIGDLTMSCQNQFFRFYKEGQFKMRHSISISEKIKYLPNLITIALSEQMKLINAYKTFAKTKIHSDLIDTWAKELVGMDRAESIVKDGVSPKAVGNMNKLYNHLEKEIEDKGLNLWGLHSGVTSWTTHDKQAPNREGGRLESLMVGTNYRVNIKSLEMALDYAGISI